MNNKLLVVIVVLMALFGIGFLVYQKSFNSTSPQVSSVDTMKEAEINKPAETTNTPGNEPTPSPTVLGDSTECVRNFKEEDLKNAKVDLTGRQVEFEVAGFGKFKVELYEKDAPKTVENFLRLVNSNFYNCLTFHRVSKGFVIQGGDPLGDGTGGISAFGGEFADELNSDTASYKAGYKHGVLAMANRGPNTNSSQFFILLADYPLEHKYTIFGKIVEGLDIVDKIGQVEIVPGPFGPTDGQPKNKVIINKAIIIK